VSIESPETLDNENLDSIESLDGQKTSQTFCVTLELLFQDFNLTHYKD